MFFYFLSRILFRFGYFKNSNLLIHFKNNIMSIWSFFSHLFNSLFNATQAAWDRLPQPVKTGILNGSGIFHILSNYIGQDPKLTIATIQANYPLEDLSLLYTGLSEVAKDRGLTIPPTLEDLIVVIQTYLKGLDNNNWARVLSGLAQILGDVLTGSSTPFEVVVTFVQWVFTNLVQPKPITFAPVPQSIAAPLSNNSDASAAMNAATPASPVIAGNIPN